MALTNIHFDLFGAPVLTLPPRQRRVATIRQAKVRPRPVVEESINLDLFQELFESLKKPLLPENVELPADFASDIVGVSLIDDEDAESSLDLASIPYEAWGKPWVTDENGHKWSREGLLFLQVRLFWRSIEELTLINNEQEKWSCLRWIFRPAYWKHYMYDERIGRSRCLAVHERDEPFSFHNCCIAARVDAETVREGVSRNVPADVIKAVERVCRFD